MTLSTYTKQFEDSISEFKGLNEQMDALTAAAASENEYFIAVDLRTGVTVRLVIPKDVARQVINDEIARLKGLRKAAFSAARTAAGNIASLL